MKKHRWIGLAIVATIITSIAYGQEYTSVRASAPDARGREASVRPYTADLFEATKANTNYRRVLFTGARSQLVVMSIPPGESIGTEKHEHIEQTIVILTGSGQAILDGGKTNIGAGDVIVITPGTQHNVVNTGTAPLQLFTTYVPPNHIDGRVHRTKSDAERDIEDHRFGEKVR